MKVLNVQVHNDYLEGLEQSRPATALSELIWNAFDSGASDVCVDFSRDPTLPDHVLTITVRYDGVGIGGEGDDPDKLFGSLGGSWKKDRRQTGNGRALHGQEGEGRFRAFSLGDTITWRTRVSRDGKVAEFSISRDKGTKSFRVAETAPDTTGATGTVVTVTRVRDKPAPDSPGVREAITREFALYLQQYPTVRLTFDGVRIDPKVLVVGSKELPVLNCQLDGHDAVTVKTTVIEWNVKMERALYLCDEDGFSLLEIPPGVQAPGFSFTAYARSAFFRELKSGNLIELELAPGREAVLDAIKESIREHFRARTAECAAGAVARWREENVYPYEGLPSGPAEAVERQVFDIMAINLSTHLTNFEKTDAKQKRVTLRLVRQAVETNPASLQTILGEVLGLPREKQDELAALLRQTSLSAIINAAHVVAGRINFLKGLEELLFDEKHKDSFLERDHLHRMLAANTWLFGEEYNLTVDDETLTEALRRHLALRGEDPSEAQIPVLREDGRSGRLDLMLSRVVPQPDPYKREHLVVELKRRSQAVTAKVISQIESYAFAVADDQRFHDVDTKWTFIAVSNEMDESVRRKAHQRNKPVGLVHDDEQALTIWAFTWGALIQRAHARLDFFKKALEYNATKASAREHLQLVYASYLPHTLSDDTIISSEVSGPPPNPLIE